MMLSLMLRLLWSCVRAGADEGQIWPARSLAFAPPAKAPARRRQTGEIQHTSGRKSFSFVFFSFFTETLPLPPLVPPALARRNRGPSPRLRTKTPGTRLRAALGAPEPLTGDQGVGRVSQACPTPGPALVDAAALSVRRAEAWAAMVVMAHLRPAQRTLASPNARSSYICFRAQSFRRLSLYVSNGIRHAQIQHQDSPKRGNREKTDVLHFGPLAHMTLSMIRFTSWHSERICWSQDSTSPLPSPDEAK